MRLLGLYSIIRIKRVNRKPKENKNPKSGFKNIVKQQWTNYEWNELWVTDVTYISVPVQNRWHYLSVLKDVKTGFIVGYKFSKINDVKIYKDTLKDAEKYRDFDKQLIIHSDNGIQYTSAFALRHAKQNNILISCSRVGNSLDNAACETFFSQLKC